MTSATFPYSFSKLFEQRFEAAIDRDEIAEPSRRLGIPHSMLVSLVSQERAEQLAGSSYREWKNAHFALQAANTRYDLERDRREHPSLPLRFAVALRRQLPGGTSFAKRRADAHRTRIEELAADRARLADQEDAAEAETLKTLDELAILRPLRAYVDERDGRAWSTQLTLSADDAPGLAELRTTPSVPLAGIDDINRRLRAMPGGSIGIAGPRGVGKTTLIRWFTSAQEMRETIGAYVSAPTRYDAREFVLHLFATICSAASGDPAEPAVQHVDAARGAARRLLQPLFLGLGGLAASAGLLAATLLALRIDARLLAGLVCFGGAVAVSMLLIASAPVIAPFGRFGPGTRAARARAASYASLAGLLTVSGGLVVLSQLTTTTPTWVWGAIGIVCSLALIAAAWPRATLLRGWTISDSPLQQEAQRLLQEIRYQMTFSTSWSGTLNVPLLGGALGGERSVASRPRTLPELLDELERFIRDAVVRRRVVIGIDELDKMDSERDAHRFLNEIKGVFGIRGCFFLVSVSEEAMSGFARRDARVRDAFDSAFDEIVYLRPLVLEQSRTLLSERVIGLPTQFGALCHVLAGGLPRDLIRAARGVIALNPPGEATPLSTIVRGIVVRELDTRARAASIALRSFGPQATRFVDWLADVERAADALQHACTRTDVWERAAEVADPVERARLTDLIFELQGFCHFALTLREVFDDDLDQAEFEARQTNGGSLEALARAHATVAVNALLAWSEVSAFRRAWGLGELAPPALPVGGTDRAVSDATGGGVASAT